MHYRYFLPAFAVLLVERHRVRRRTLRPEARPRRDIQRRESSPSEVTRLEPTVALTLGKGEAPHPRLAG